MNNDDREFYGLNNDFVFKYVFGRNNSTKPLIALLNAILRLKDQDRITKIKIENPFNYINNDYDKWLHILRFSKKYVKIYNEGRKLFDEEAMDILMDSLNRVNADTYLRAILEDREKARRDRIWYLKSAEKTGLERGLKQGEEERRKLEELLVKEKKYNEQFQRQRAEIAYKLIKEQGFGLDEAIKFISLTKHEACLLNQIIRENS